MRVVGLFFPSSTGWVLIMLGQVGTSIAGVVAMAAPPKISSVWFPPDERAAATAAGVVVNSLGNVVGFLLGLVCNQPAFSDPFACVSFQVYLQIGVTVLGTLLVFVCVRDAPEKASSTRRKRVILNDGLFDVVALEICFRRVSRFFGGCFVLLLFFLSL
jgi:MFS family permease